MRRSSFLYPELRRKSIYQFQFIALLALLLLSPSVSFAANNDPFRGGREAVTPKQSAGVGQSTGAMTYTYPLVIPPGRNGVQPDLSLNYSSDDKRQDSPFGYGWSMNLPYIERVNKLGTNNLYNQDTDNTFFYSSLSGELLQVGTTSPISGSFLGFSLSTLRLALLDTPSTYPFGASNESSVESDSTSLSQPTPVTADPQKVSDEVARSFHTFTDTFLSTHIYHPNEWADWFVGRERAKIEALKPIAGFPVAETKRQTTKFSVIPNPLFPALELLSAEDRATLKGQAIAQFSSISKFNYDDNSIEIQSIEPIEGGVQVFARAWDKNNNAIGFGADGTVEIERFRFFNPPIMVPDGTTHTAMDTDHTDLTFQVNNYKEDLLGALQHELAHAIAVVGKEGTHIIKGKVGHTTDTYYPDADPETSSVDGQVCSQTTNATWATVHDASSGDVAYPSGQGAAAFLEAHTNTNKWNSICRSFFLFDTSPIADTDVISSATFSGKAIAKNDQSWSTTYNIYPSTPGSNTDLVTADFSRVGTTSLSTAVPFASFTVGSFTEWALNATGIASVSTTGDSKFSFREATYDVVNSAPSWVSSGFERIVLYSAESSGGTTDDPKLVVVHSAAPTGPSAPTDLLVDGLTNPSNIATTSPYFSAIHVNASTTALATSYEIQVDTAGTFTSPYWDSGKMTLSSSTPPSMRSPNIFATTTFVTDGTKYYWRIKFWDQANGEGSWSTTGDHFIMQITGDYMAKVDDGSFMKYTLQTDGSWIAYDKSGWKYTFGATSNARINDPDTSSKIYRWYLEEIADPNGNKVLYRYAKDGGQVYPDYIDYTDHQGGSLFEVDFTKDFCDVLGSPCAPFATSSMYGFPVFTRYLISDITAAALGVIHRYTPTYTLGDNQSRVLLSSITEKGYRDGSGTGALAFPPTNFTYQTSTTTWTEVTDANSWQMNFDVSDTSNNDYGWRSFDINGDALLDWVKSDGSSQAVLLNTGSKWATSTAWTVPVAFSKNNIEQGIRMAEVNGDGLIDIIAATSTKVVYLNNGTNTWIASTTWAFPVSFIDSGNRDQGVQLVDVNGDGLADVLRAHYASTTATTTAVYTNNGHGWTQDTGWTIPEVLVNDLKDSAVRLYDYTGDGLVDIIFSPYPNVSGDLERVYINNGRGWTRDGAVNVPFNFAEVGAVISEADRGIRFADFNGDGCVDIAQGLTSITKDIRMSNCSDGWEGVVQNTLPEYFRDTASDYGVRTDDIDGDGQLDIVRSFYDSGTGARTRKVYLKNGDAPDLLKEVSNSRKGKTTVTYQGSPEYRDGGGTLLNPNLPFVAQTVRTLTTDNGSYLTTGRVIATTTYDYQRGYFYGTSTDPLLRRFAGFGLVTATSTTIGAVTKTYFHQGNGGNDAGNGEFGDDISKAGRPYRTETFNQSGNLLSRVINKWGRADYGDGRNFVKLGQTLTQIFDGDSTHRDTAASTTYSDTTGDLALIVNYGEVSGNSDGTFSDIGTDLASTTYTYAASSTNATVSYPSRELVVDQSGNTVKDTKWTYDNLSFGSVTYGNPTKEERLISGSRYASTTKIYDGTYGLVATSTDPLGNATGFVYDGYNLFPIVVRNALNQEKLFSYDYSQGKVATTTDENNQTVVIDFDNLDRPIREKQPDFVTPTTLVTKTTYAYTDSTTTPSSVFRSDHLSTATTTDSYVYLDGFDRTIQSKREAESANGWITKDTIYNSIGKVREESLPYFTTTSSYSAPTSTSALFVTNGYDAIGRVLTTANVVGTTTNAYSDWRLTTTDALSNKKDFNKDAYGNLASVVEYPSAGATTTYTWSLLGKLAKITDASSNIRNFTYDNLGRLTGAEDLHASGDTTFGTTSRQYDDAGNLVQVYTPRGNAINYTYDTLNRVTSEDATTTTPGLTDVVYRYDTCTNGKGRLCEVNANDAATTTHAYNPIGLVSTEAKQVGSSWATTSTSYFRAGAVDTLTYPDSHQIAYSYNDAGDLYRVLGLTNGSTTWNTLVESITYGPHGRPLTLDYGNNTQTTYTYNASQLYRLTRKLTISTSTTSGSPEQLLFLGMMLKLKGLALLDDPVPFETVQNLPAEPVVPDVETTTSLESSSPQAVPETPSVSSPQEPQTIVEVPSVAQPTVASLAESIKNLPAHDRATLKGQAISRLGNIAKFNYGDNSIEIQNIEPIEGGVQVLARAWDKSNDPIGFGADGTVEIERFRFFNPRILVPDGTTHVATDTDRTYQVNNYKEDLLGALQHELAHAVTVAGKERTHIIKGKVGHTTDTYYPDTDPETSSVDGQVQRLGTNLTWADVHDGAGTQAYPSGQGMSAYMEAGTTANKWAGITRSIMLFDTSPIADNDVVSSATLSAKEVTKNNQSWSTTFNIYSSTPASNTDLVTGDYSQVGTTAFSTAIPFASFSDNVFADWALNASGVAAVSTTGDSKFSFREATYEVANSAPSWVSGGFERVVLYSTESSAGTTDDPKLVVVHSAAPTGPSAPTNLLTDGLTNPSNIATTSPYFSAIHVNASTTALATDYQIQIDTAGTFASPYWDSGKKTLASSTPQNMRTPDIFSTTTFAVDGTTYYWRIKFWDQTSMAGEWSTATSTFKMRAANTVLQDLNYVYDLVGNIITIQDYSGHNGAASTSHQYDNLYRLTRASSTDAVTTNWLQTYAYNDIGNITSKSDVGSYTYAGTGFINPHAPTQVGAVDYSYDKAGNLLAAGAAAYTWNYRNRLTDTNINSTTTHYQYDFNDQRVQQDVKIGAAATSSTVYWNKYFQTAGATTTLYVFLPSGELLATVEGNGSATSTYMVHTDHQGGVNVLSNSVGGQAQLSTFFPYGALRNNEKAPNGGSIARKFLSQYTDDSTNLNYLNARFQDGARGQFLSEDPVANDIAIMSNMAGYILGVNQTPGMFDQTALLSNPQLLNSYSYAGNNPVTLSDPSGKYIEVSAGATAMGFSGAAGIRFDGGGLDIFAAGGVGLGFGGGPLTVSWAPGVSLSHVPESTMNVGAEFTSPFGGININRSGAYESQTASLKNPLTQVSIVFGRLSADAYARKEISTPIFARGHAPSGLTLTNGPSYSTPNYAVPPGSLFMNQTSMNSSASSAARSSSLNAIQSAFRPTNAAQAAAVQQVMAAFRR